MESTIKKKVAKNIQHENGHGVNGISKSERLKIKKSYKLYIDGKFPRTESGRFYKLTDKAGNTIANVCRASRKDLRESIVSNRKAFSEWSKKTAYNKGQILYRIAETLEGRKSQFVDTMVLQGYSQQQSVQEVNKSVELLVYYAGWTDKYIQVFSSVNPVESSHFNFSYPEPSGVVVAFPSETSPLSDLVASVIPAIAGGNTVTAIASEKFPLTSIEFAEVLHASDVTAGTVNLLTGYRKELLSHAASHMDINVFIYNDLSDEHLKMVQTSAALNVKRVVDFSKEDIQSPYRILSCQEIKTTWHPVGY